MQECIKAVSLKHDDKENLYDVKRFGYENAKKVNAFHRSFPEYSVTPLAEMNGLAKMLGVKSIHVKDESYRFGLNAFKVLGGSYSMAMYIADLLGIGSGPVTWRDITSPGARAALGDVTFITATDGNHGRGDP